MYRVGGDGEDVLEEQDAHLIGPEGGYLRPRLLDDLDGSVVENFLSRRLLGAGRSAHRVRPKGKGSGV